MSLDLDPDFGEFVECLGRRNVRYLVVGGYALAAHGLPRDLDDVDRLLGNGDADAGP